MNSSRLLQCRAPLWNSLGSAWVELSLHTWRRCRTVESHALKTLILLNFSKGVMARFSIFWGSRYIFLIDQGWILLVLLRIRVPQRISSRGWGDAYPSSLSDVCPSSVGGLLGLVHQHERLSFDENWRFGRITRFDLTNQ